MKSDRKNKEALKSYQAALQAYSSGEYERAESMLVLLTSRMPGFADAYHLLGICQYSKSDLVQAERSIRSALSITKHADFYLNLGLVLQQAGNADGAVDAYRAALKLNSKLPNACNNLANILSKLNKHDEAIDLYRQAIALQPNYAIGYKNLGAALKHLKRNEEAEEALLTAIKLDGSFSDAKELLADLLLETEHFEQAFEIYREIGALGRLQSEKRKIVDWTNISEIDRELLDQLRSGVATPAAPWRLIQMPGLDSVLEKRAARSFAMKEMPELQAVPLCKPRPVSPADGRLRIGYLSADFYNHATMHLLAGILEQHDRTQNEIFIFSYGPKRDDAYSERLRATNLQFVDIEGVSDQIAAQEILRREIDILVDLKGYTTSARLGITALRPAPIIVSWLGYPGTLGHERLADYLVGDGTVTPPQEAQFYTERLALMPNSYQPNDRKRLLPHAISRSDAGLPENGLVFCSFNQTVKFNPQTFDVWGQLLEQVPGSVLWLLSNSTVAQSNIVKEFARRKIEAERIVFAPFLPQEQHLARLRLCDIALDTLPYNSHTTASDALWVGVPLITLKGSTFAGRVAASLLATHGFPELITETADQYLALSLELARDPARLAELKERLDQSRMKSPLFDTAQFARDLEQLYRAIADNHNKPEALRAPVVTTAPPTKGDSTTVRSDVPDELDWQSFRAALATYNDRNYQEAIASLRQLVSNAPNFAQAHNLLGICYLAQDAFDAARDAIKRALEIAEQPEFHANLGVILLRSGNLTGAAEAFRSSLRLNPNSFDVCNNLANILSNLRQNDQAQEFYRLAIKLKPDFAIGYRNLGACLFALGRYEEAEAAFLQAISLDASYSDAKVKLADLYMHLQRYESAFELYRSIGAWGWLQFGKRSCVSWDGLSDVDLNFVKELAEGSARPTSPWCVLQMSETTPMLERRVAWTFARHILKGVNDELVPRETPVSAQNRRLRVGYLSADFYSHATMHLLAGVLESHDREQFDVTIFSYGPERDDDCALRLQNMGFPIIALSKMSDRQAAQEIHRLEMDILIDLKGHTGSARTGITALRPAPIIINWLGHPGTLGDERLADYIIGDEIITPPEDSQFYSERLALMPNTYQPNDRKRPLAKSPSRKDVGLPESGPVFCSFNQAAKFNPETFDIWGKLLKAVPNGILWLLSPPSNVTRLNIVREFGKRGISEHRLIFAPSVGQAEHLARLQLVDVALDTFPYNSHTTASDVLWAGVPLITLKGSTFASRVAASLLSTHGFSELITETADDYLSLALELATNPARLGEIKARLDQARMTSPLFDTERFAGDLEQLYRAIVDNHNKPNALRAPVVALR